MKQLNQLYSQLYNWKYQRVGPVLQGRYKAWLIEKEEKFLDNSRYIVNNPVEAKMVQHPSEWPWSSFRATRGLEKVPGYSDSFITEAMQHVNENDELNNVPKVQKHANRTSLENIFNETRNNSKEHRNHLILKAHDIHAYTQSEIGKYLGLHPGYISNIVLKCRKD